MKIILYSLRQEFVLSRCTDKTSCAKTLYSMGQKRPTDKRSSRHNLLMEKHPKDKTSYKKKRPTNRKLFSEVKESHEDWCK